MSLREINPAFPIDPAAPAVVAALEDDPFYRSIAAEFASSDAQRRAALELYFDYSIQEGTRMGRAVHTPDERLGVAVWLVPQSAETQQREAGRKAEFLRDILGAEGASNYHRMVDFMTVRANAIVPGDSWYLSIIAVAPHAQGRGLGRTLLAPTLAEADAAHAPCYLETFTPRSVNFYERLGFRTTARFVEPTAQAEYAILIRAPRAE